MTLDEAEQLARSFRRYAPGGVLTYSARVRTGPTERFARVDPSTGRPRPALRPSAKLVFSGPRGAEHTIDVYASSPARAIAHWEGFVPEGDLRPRVGQRVQMLKGAGGYQGSTTGEVVRVGRTRALVRFGYRTTNRITERWVPFTGLAWRSA